MGGFFSHDDSVVVIPLPLHLRALFGGRRLSRIRLTSGHFKFSPRYADIEVPLPMDSPCTLEHCLEVDRY